MVHLKRHLFTVTLVIHLKTNVYIILTSFDFLFGPEHGPVTFPRYIKRQPADGEEYGRQKGKDVQQEVFVEGHADGGGSHVGGSAVSCHVFDPVDSGF